VNKSGTVSCSDPLVDAFSRWVPRVAWSALPASTREMARLEWLDLVGDAVAGRALMGMPAWLEAVLGTGNAVVVGGHRAGPADAAFANGYFGHVLELDDTHDEAVLHAGVTAWPAALAAAQSCGGVSGARFMEALVLGIEITCRLGVATRLNLVEGGWIYSSLLGHFGAAAAAAHVLGGDAATVARALGVVYCLTSGNHQSSREGAATKHIQPGVAAANGVRAALMAMRGLVGPALPFAGEDGLARVYLHDRLEAARALDGLGTRFETERLSFKPYPSCRLTHAPIHAALQLRERLGDDCARIEAITLELGPQAFDVVGRDEPEKRWPTGKVAAQFSAFWCVAVAMTYGEVSPRHVFDEVPPGPRVAAWLERIRCSVDAAAGTRDVGGCRLVATGAFGRTEVAVASALGSPENPLSRAALAAKFRANVALAGIDASAADRFADELLALETAADLSGVVARLEAPVPAAQAPQR
jgi:2-methylcitrate dehydratase PrpD